ncbi:MAG: hypothetical protein U1E76_22150 [Planctomycetota bacterium]
MIDRQLLEHLRQRGVRYCLIGASALAAHGWARFTADVDLLTMDDVVLDPRFWSGFRTPEIRRGDADDPLAGLVRFAGDCDHDVIVGRGGAMAFAVHGAVPSPALGCPVATPLALLLLKLEAGGPQDRSDIIGLVQAQRVLNGALWLAQVDQHLELLSTGARRIWQELRPAL